MGWGAEAKYTCFMKTRTAIVDAFLRSKKKHTTSFCHATFCYATFCYATFRPASYTRFVSFRAIIHAFSDTKPPAQGDNIRAMIHASNDTKPPSRGDNIWTMLHTRYTTKPPPGSDNTRDMLHARYNTTRVAQNVQRFGARRATGILARQKVTKRNAESKKTVAFMGGVKGIPSPSINNKNRHERFKTALETVHEICFFPR